MSLSCAAPAVRARSKRCSRRCEYARLNSAADLGDAVEVETAPSANEKDDAGAGAAGAGEADKADEAASARGNDDDGCADHSSCMHPASQPTSR